MADATSSPEGNLGWAWPGSGLGSARGPAGPINQDLKALQILVNRPRGTPPKAQPRPWPGPAQIQPINKINIFFIFLVEFSEVSAGSKKSISRETSVTN